MKYLDILQDKEIMAILNQIDVSKQYEAKHYGIIHTLNTVEFSKQLSECFELNEKEVELLLVCCALHNIGHLNGKNLHAQTGAEMAKGYLLKRSMPLKDINVICNAIRSHTGKRNDDFYNNVSCCMILADKMDFGASRYKANFAKLSAEDRVCKKITYVEAKRINDTVQLVVGGFDVDWDKFIQTSTYSKIYSCFSMACKKAGLKFVFKKTSITSIFGKKKIEG